MGSTLRNRILASVSALALGALAASATTWALWSDVEETSGQIGVGVIAFAAGQVGSPTPATTSPGQVTYTFPESATQTLLTPREVEGLPTYAVAVPIQVDALSQGNRGLTYTLTPPATDGSGTGAQVWDDATVRVYLVDDPAECTVEAANERGEQEPDPFTQIPVSTDYSDTTEPTTQFWCVYAFAEPTEGEPYVNVGTVTATNTDGLTDEDSDTWSASVINEYVAEQQVEPSMDFTFETFRNRGDEA